MLKNRVVVSLLVLVIALSIAGNVSATSRVGRIANIARHVGRINAIHGIDAPLEDFPFFAGRPQRIRIGYAINKGIKRYWNTAVLANCPKLDDAAKLFPVHNKKLFCYALQVLRAFSELQFIIWEDGSFIIEGCIPTMGCTPKITQ